MTSPKNSQFGSARRLPPLNALRALEAVGATGSITAAAARLRVSHSAVSHQIRQLEAWLGRPLILRRGRSVALTPAGESLAGVVHASFDAIRHELDRLPLRAQRAITVAALPVVASEIVLPRLSDFAARHPGLTLHLSLVHADSPARGAPDIEILFARRDRLLPGDRPLLPGTALPVAAPALVARAGGIEAVLRGGPFVADEDLRMWEAWARAAGHAPDMGQTGLIFEGSFLMQEAARRGLGAAICRTATIADDLASGRLVALSDVTIDADWCYLLRLGATAANEPDIRAVSDWLTALPPMQLGRGAAAT